MGTVAVTTLATAEAEAARCGVTRLADITGLDTLAVPVFQAVRPWSRALSVHQGKGLTPEAAKIGALMEAVESDHAEAFDAPRMRAPFDAIPDGERGPTIEDFACARDQAPHPAEPLFWVEARRLDGDGALWVPFDAVCHDYSRPADPRLDRSSNGLAARGDLEGATVKALLEIVERDADRAWRASPIHCRSLDRIDERSIPYRWFRCLEDRLREAGLRLSIYQQPAVIPLPVFMSQIIEPGAGVCRRRNTVGVACHPVAEEALLGSVLEAIQSRLTAISGVRDDIYFDDEVQSEADGVGLGLPLPPGLHPKLWEGVAEDSNTGRDLTAAELGEMLARAGYPDAAIVDLSRPGRAVAVVKALVLGLGAFGRTRRPPGGRP